jgi:mRNA-degrading endonuclease toxin of MazEF toxin-antitoxin module
VPLTSSLRWSLAPGNVYLEAAATGLPKESVPNVPQVVTLDSSVLDEREGKLSDREVARGAGTSTGEPSGVAGGAAIDAVRACRATTGAG